MSLTTITNNLIAEPGRHAFDGSCAPGSGSAYHSQDTFSVGVFEWVPKAGGKGCKRGPVKVRIKGIFSSPEKVYARAREVVELLDAGAYTGTKIISV